MYGTNNATAFNSALSDPYVRTHGYLLVPAGMYIVGGGVTLDILSNMEICGRGRSSVIYAANYVDSGFYAQSQERVALRNLAFRSHGYTRSSRSTTAAMWIRECEKVEVQNIYVDGSTSAGVFVDLCETVHVTGVEVRNTKADGVHIVGCVEAMVDGVRGYNTGDDTVSIVSYLSQAQAVKVMVSNVLSVNARTRGVTVGGSANVMVSHCQVIAPGAHGILVAYESGGANPAAELHTPHNVTISNCRVEDALGSLGPPEGFNSILVAGDATHKVDDVTIQGCTVVGSNQAKIVHAENVRFLNNEIRDSRYSGLLIEDSEDVDTLNCKFKNIEGIGLSYVRITDGQISGNRLTDCQTLNEFGTNASEGRIHIVDSTDIYGFGNRDKRATTVIPSFGAILVSGGARVTVGVTEIDADAVDTNKRIKGMEVASLRDAGTYKDQLLLGTNIPVNQDRYAIAVDRGMYVEEGDIHIDGAGKFLGSGGAASLDLLSGFAQLVAASSARIWINRNDASSGNTFFITTGSAETYLVTLTTGGELFIKGGLHPGNTSSGVGFFAYDGNPEGVVSAPVGSFCIRNWSVLSASGTDGPMYHKESGGTGNTGWVVVPGLANEIPSVSGNAKKSLRVNNAGTGYGWDKVPVDDPSAISIASIPAARFLYHQSGGGGQIVGIGPADVWALIESIAASALSINSTFVAAMKSALAHTHEYVDRYADSTTGTGGADSHDHSIPGDVSTETTGPADW